jgi:predicted  nucleic acid-binding Zn-ribbon protein
VAIDLETLKAERDKLKDGLRELETEQRKLENDLKALRQREIRTKREIEALTTLVDLAESRKSPDEANEKSDDLPASSASAVT